MNKPKQTYKYFAFISYNSKDTKWGKRLQRKLEGYRIPATLCSEHGWNRKPIKPVFFAPTDIQPGGLTKELQERLEASRNLIVICSPNSAKSEWVGKEIAYFHSLGREKDIHFFIVDGIPHSGDKETECFNPIIKELGIPEILGANIHEKVIRCSWINKERAYVQLITKLLGVEFDSIWQRHKRLLAERCLLLFFCIDAVIIMLISVWKNNQPVDVSATLEEVSVHNPNLPPLKDAIVSITIDKETKTDTIDNINGDAFFANIPHYMIGKDDYVNVSCNGWLPIDTIVTLTELVNLKISRDPNMYGAIRFRLFDLDSEEYCKSDTVSVNGHVIISDSDGVFSFFMPLDEQSTFYTIKSRIPLENDTLRMPNTQSTGLIAKNKKE